MTDPVMAGRTAVMARLSALFTEFPDEQAIQFEGTWWTWGHVGQIAASLATSLASEGVASRGAPIAIVMRQRPVLVAAELAVLAMGRTALLVSPLQPDGPLAADIATIPAAVVIAHSIDWRRTGFAEAVAAAQVVGIELDDDGGVILHVTPPIHRLVESIDAAVTVLTSGTTGPAKRLPVSWESFVTLGGGPVGRESRSGRGAVILSLPLTTLGGLLSMSRLVFGGRPLSMMERFDVRTWAALVKEHRPKVMGAPPPVVKMILDADISPDHFVGIEAYLTSSAAVAPEVARAFEARYGIPVLLGYGATEFLNDGPLDRIRCHQARQRRARLSRRSPPRARPRRP
jgi:long-chain acyl-CoA synthetase